MILGCFRETAVVLFLHAVQDDLVFFHGAVRNVNPFLLILLQKRSIRFGYAKLIHGEEELSCAGSRDLRCPSHAIDDVLPHESQDPKGFIRLAAKSDLIFLRKIQYVNLIGVTASLCILPNQDLIVFRGPHASVFRDVQNLLTGLFLQVHAICRILETEIQVLALAEVQKLFHLDL